MQSTQPSPSPSPTPPEAPQIIVNGVPATAGGPSAILRGFQAQRRELRDQLEDLQNRRSNLSGRLHDPQIKGADRAGLEQQITNVDARIADLDKQIAVADAQVARASAVPGAVVEPPRVVRDGPPDEVYVLSGMFIVLVLLPISLAIARRIWRRGTAAVASLPQEVMDRLARLDHAVDSIAVEVERIGEGQRFVTRIISERPLPEASVKER